MPRTPLAIKLWDSYIRELRFKNQQLTKNTLSKSGKRGAWRRWHREGTITAALPLVARVARDLRRLFARHLDPRDLAQAGALGLVQAAAAYDPALGAFEAFAYFRIRGAIIDSQKRRTYLNEACVSLQSMREANDDWLPPAIEADPGPGPDVIADAERQRQRLARIISTLPDADRRAIAIWLSGATEVETAARLGRGVTWTRQRLAAAREVIRREMR